MGPINCVNPSGVAYPPAILLRVDGENKFEHGLYAQLSASYELKCADEATVQISRHISLSTQRKLRVGGSEADAVYIDSKFEDRPLFYVIKIPNYAFNNSRII